MFEFRLIIKINTSLLEIKHIPLGILFCVLNWHYFHILGYYIQYTGLMLVKCRYFDISVDKRASTYALHCLEYIIHVYIIGTSTYRKNGRRNLYEMH